LNETNTAPTRDYAPRAEILELIANGLSHREIAEKLFVSENTVKTHSSRAVRQAERQTKNPGVATMGKRVGIDSLSGTGVRPLIHAQDARAT